jgi:hypothetical protein
MKAVGIKFKTFNNSLRYLSCFATELKFHLMLIFCAVVSESFLINMAIVAS